MGCPGMISAVAVCSFQLLICFASPFCSPVVGHGRSQQAQFDVEELIPLRNCKTEGYFKHWHHKSTFLFFDHDYLGLCLTKMENDF